VAEQRFVSAGEYGSQPASVLIHPVVSDRKRFAVKPVKSSASQPPMHRDRLDSKRQ
jgi:hypothetical protein